MRISLATSLHLDHGARRFDARAEDPLTMQAFVPIGLLSLKAVCNQAHPRAAVNVVEINGLLNRGAIANGDELYLRLAETILAGGDDLVGLMTDADSLHHSVAIARSIKHQSPRTMVCLGGPA